MGSIVTLNMAPVHLLTNHVFLLLLLLLLPRPQILRHSHGTIHAAIPTGRHSDPLTSIGRNTGTFFIEKMPSIPTGRHSCYPDIDF